jgi:protein-tyrosine phosphatase
VPGPPPTTWANAQINAPGKPRGRFDYVLAMDESNLMDLQALEGATEHSGHLGLLRAFDAIAPPGAEVPDPYYGGDSGFEDVLDLCEAACRGLLERIREDFELS